MVSDLTDAAIAYGPSRVCKAGSDLQSRTEGCLALTVFSDVATLSYLELAVNYRQTKFFPGARFFWLTYSY
jgi:hypothetical protein